MKKFILICTVLLINLSAICQYKAIQVIKTGKGNPVMFLPGFTCPGSIWSATMKNLNTSRECITVSYAGFNGLPSIDTPWYSALKRELIQYIRKEKLTNLTIIGHSMGGDLAIEIAAALPNNISKLILLDAIPCMRELTMPGVSVSEIQYNSPYNNQMLAMSTEAFRQIATMMASNMASQKDKIDSIINWIMQANRNTYIYGYTDLLKLDLRDMLKQVKAKTLILGASYPNVDVAKATFEKQYANLSNKSIQMASDSKHFIMFDQPTWFYEKVNGFLDNE